MKKLKAIMLIDDNRHDNIFHERAIKKADVTNNIVIMKKADEALEYLASIDPSDPGYPELIFLDINMPGMNGWEFLDKFKGLDTSKRPPIIVMLTTSTNPDDEAKAYESGLVYDFRCKPLSKEMVNEIMGKFFS
jgi:CheY-like chemotaxis protein